MSLYHDLNAQGVRLRRYTPGDGHHSMFLASVGWQAWSPRSLVDLTLAPLNRTKLRGRCEIPDPREWNDDPRVEREWAGGAL